MNIDGEGNAEEILSLSKKLSSTMQKSRASMMEERHKTSKGKIVLNAQLRNQGVRSSLDKKNYLKSLLVADRSNDESLNDDYNNNFTVGASTALNKRTNSVHQRDQIGEDYNSTFRSQNPM